MSQQPTTEQPGRAQVQIRPTGTRLTAAVELCGERVATIQVFVRADAARRYPYLVGVLADLLQDLSK